MIWEILAIVCLLILAACALPILVGIIAAILGEDL